MFGLTSEEASPDLAVWPDNLEIVICFLSMSTQWTVGVNGVTGLNYAALPFVMEMQGVTNKQEVFAGLQTMECTALQLMQAKK